MMQYQDKPKLAYVHEQFDIRLLRKNIIDHDLEYMIILDQYLIIWYNSKFELCTKKIIVAVYMSSIK